jgi:hypothetical protein
MIPKGLQAPRGRPQRKLQTFGEIDPTAVRFRSTSSDSDRPRPECNPDLRGRRLPHGHFGSTSKRWNQINSAIIEFHDRIDEGVSRRRSGEESAMVRQAGHSDGFEAIIRANRTFLLGLLWGALFACVAVASVYDVGRWVNLW